MLDGYRLGFGGFEFWVFVSRMHDVLLISCSEFGLVHWDLLCDREFEVLDCFFWDPWRVGDYMEFSAVDVS